MIALFVFLWLAAGVSSFDTEGQQYFFTFIRNGDPNTNLPNQNLSLTIINGANDGSCDFSILYSDQPTWMAYQLKKVTVTVEANSTQELPVPAWYGFAFDTTESPQYSSVPSVTLLANSTCPVTLLANNYDSSTGQGDTFVVLPVAWSSTYYSFTLPPADKDPHQYQVVTFIPTQRDTNIQFQIIEHSAVFNITAKFQGEATTYIALPTPEGKARTYRVFSDAPIQIVAGVTCVGVYGGRCDHIAFMPHPLPSGDCANYEWVNDYHVSDTVSTNTFYVDMPKTCTDVQIVNASNSGSATTNRITIPISLDPTKTSTIQSFNVQTFGRAVKFHSVGSATHVTRIYDSSADLKSGAYATSVPAMTSYIVGPSYFYTRNDDDTIEVICSVLLCASMTIDGVKLFDNSTGHDSIKIDVNTTYYSFSFPVQGQGYHAIEFPLNHKGLYTYYVIGKTEKYSYGYIGQANIPQLVTVGTTTQTSTSTATTTTSPSTTTSSPTVPVVSSTSTVATSTTTPPSSSTTASSSSTTSATTSASTTNTPSTVASTSTSSTPSPVTTPATTVTSTTSPVTTTSMSSTVTTTPVKTTVSTPGSTLPTTIPVASTSSTTLCTTTPSTTQTTSTTSPSTSASSTPSSSTPGLTTTASSSTSSTSTSSSTPPSTHATSTLPITTPVSSTSTATTTVTSPSTSSPLPTVTSPSTTVTTVTLPSSTASSTSVTYTTASPSTTPLSSTSPTTPSRLPYTTTQMTTSTVTPVLQTTTNTPPVNVVTTTLLTTPPSTTSSTSSTSTSTLTSTSTVSTTTSVPNTSTTTVTPSTSSTTPKTTTTKKTLPTKATPQVTTMTVTTTTQGTTSISIMTLVAIVITLFL